MNMLVDYDSDNDGLSDYDEVKGYVVVVEEEHTTPWGETYTIEVPHIYHTDPLNWDTDGDLIGDKAEITVGEAEVSVDISIDSGDYIFGNLNITAKTYGYLYVEIEYSVHVEISGYLEEYWENSLPDTAYVSLSIEGKNYGVIASLPVYNGVSESITATKKIYGLWEKGEYEFVLASSLLTFINQNLGVYIVSHISLNNIYLYDPYVTDPTNPDTDGDGYISIYEAYEYAVREDSKPEYPQIWSYYAILKEITFL